MLEEREQQDILDEYAQHIDMKIQNGMSEEEAIRDFGPVKELAAEILEAYHVNPEYGDSSRRVKMDFESAAQSAEQGIRSAGSFLKRAGKKLGQWISEACAWIGKPIHKKPAGEPVEQRREPEARPDSGQPQTAEIRKKAKSDMVRQFLKKQMPDPNRAYLENSSASAATS